MASKTHPIEDRCETCGHRVITRNQKALAETIEALTLGPEHAALVAQAETLASLIDVVPIDDRFHREYRQVLERIITLGTPEDTDAFAKLIAIMGAVSLGGDGAGDAP